ncbi:MAG: hypothetical protein WDN03_10640 [Rhizomicrobium sp.]
MASRFIVAGLAAAFLSLAAPAGAAPAANGVSPQDVRSMVGLIEYLYAGYDNGANERKSFFETVPWDIDTGRLIGRVDTCQRAGDGEVIDYDWPSDSQDPTIKNLSVTYEGGTRQGHATVRAAFSQGGPKPVVIHYDMTLYQDAPLPRRWGVNNIRIQDSRGTDDLLKNLSRILATDCKAFE